LKYIILGHGSGIKAEAGKQVAVHYAGSLTDGKEFDNSFKRGKPIKFILGTGKVIKGWDEGIAYMRVGDSLRLIIPPQLGYGQNGAGNVIPPNATLIFDTKLMAVSEPKLSIADSLLMTIFTKGIDAAVTQYHMLYKTQKDKYDFDEEALNELAYRFIQNNMLKNAIELLKLNMGTYPDSYNVYDSLGEAYMMNGDKELAKQNFEKSLKLNPQNANAEEMLKKLDVK
jgi:tetratricopeptide (TPR) repeat protein